MSRNKINIYIFTLLITLMIATPSCIQAQLIGDQIAEKALETAGTGGAEYQYADIATIAGSIIQVILLVIGSLFLALMIYGGGTWMLARGASDKVSKAKDVIIDATLGIIIIGTAYAVTYFIIQKIFMAKIV